MVVEDWLLTPACQKPRPGRADCICHQYVNRLKIVAATSVASSSHVRFVMVFQTAE